jgi:hypothetical protein
MLDWLAHAGPVCTAATSYVPLPLRVRQLTHSRLQQITGPNGTHLLR